MYSTIQVPKMEFLSLKKEIAVMEERIDILMDKELMGQLVESERDREEGRVYRLEDVKKELGF